MKEKIRSFLNEEIEQENIPGAVIHVSLAGDTLIHEAVGQAQLFPTKRPMKEETVFDLASLTKVVATLPALLLLVEQGIVRLDDTAQFFLPEFENAHITLRHLLTHSSGLPAHRQFYKESLSTSQIIQRISGESKEILPGKKTMYSDLGLILLYRIIEIAAGESFGGFVKKELFDPLEMHDTGFSLPYGKERFAATEKSIHTDEIKSGIVHDENAEAMGGTSGHAGLFSTAEDLAHFARMIEQDGIWKGRRILSEATLSSSRKNYSLPGQEARGLGWMLKGNDPSSCGDLFSDRSYGHTGYTGTSLWFDPEIALHVILLTNRVHSKNQKGILRLRPRLHNLIRASLS